MLVFRSLNGRSGARYGRSAGRRDGGRPPRPAATAASTSSSRPYGLLVPGQVYAMVAQRHMAEFGTTHEQLGAIAVTCRRARQRQPQRPDGRPAADDRRLPRRTVAVAAAAAVRLLPRDRRRVRRRRHRAPSGPPTARTRRCSSGPWPRAAGPGVQGGTINPILMRDDLHDLAVGPRRPHALPAGRPRPGRHRRGPDLRLLHDHRARPARGLRVLRQGRGRAVRGVSGAIGHRRLAADQHRRRAPLGGLHPRHEPHRRGRAPAPRDVDRRRSPAPRRAWSPAASPPASSALVLRRAA